MFHGSNGHQHLATRASRKVSRKFSIWAGKLLGVSELLPPPVKRLLSWTRDLRPVTPEVAGLSPVGPAKLKHPCAATCGVVCLSTLKSAKQPAQGAAQGASFKRLRNMPN